MFGISMVILFLIVSIGISWWHGRFKLGQIMFGIFLGLLLASVAPSLASSSHTFIVSIGNAIENIKWH